MKLSVHSILQLLLSYGLCGRNDIKNDSLQQRRILGTRVFYLFIYFAGFIMLVCYFVFIVPQTVYVYI